ncbi:MAG: hypothetical protein HYT43_02625 [Candidatus Taylorbacteria bacterium]|nr:hypothetical protein [Candidatus Taylorbacteria bacterium]
MALIGVAIVFLAYRGEAPKIEREAENFQSFWRTFRAAVVAGDTNGVMARTAFPFKTRGPLDDDPVKTHPAEEFPAMLAMLLRQDAGVAAAETPMKDLIARTDTVAERNFDRGHKTVRLGAFVFQVVDGKWWFTMAYTAG